MRLAEAQAKSTAATMTKAVQNAASRAKISAALEKVQVAQSAFEESKYVKVASTANGKTAEAALSAAKQELQSTFKQAALGSLTAQEAYTAAFAVGVSAATRMGIYNASLSQFGDWAMSLSPGPTLTLALVFGPRSNTNPCPYPYWP